MITRRGGYLAARSAEQAPAASSHLEAEGFALLPGVLDAAGAEALRLAISQIYACYPGDRRGSKRSVDEDDMFRYEMLNRSQACQSVVANRQILDVIEPLLGEDCHVIANTAWRNPPGHAGANKGQAWHIDAGPHIPLPAGTTWPMALPHPVFAIATHIYLQDCQLEDGPTGVIPRSHLSGQFPPPERPFDPDLRFDDQGVVPLLARAGDVGLFVSDVWHRRMPAGSEDHGRFFLQVHYGRRDLAQRLRPSAVANQLSDQAIDAAVEPRLRTLIGLHPPYFYDG